MHLCKAEPVVLLYDNRLYIFTCLGLYVLTKATAKVLKTEPFKNVLCLVDLDAIGHSFLPTVLSCTSLCFMVAASSLQYGDHHNWVKHDIATVVLNVPSNRDLGNL